MARMNKFYLQFLDVSVTGITLGKEALKPSEVVGIKCKDPLNSSIQSLCTIIMTLFE